MPSTSTPRKSKLTITISGDVVNEIDEIAKEKGTPRSQVMEEMLRDLICLQNQRIVSIFVIQKAFSLRSGLLLGKQTFSVL